MRNPFDPLKNKLFTRLYLSQTIPLLGDAFTWVGVALLAYQFGGKNSAAILSMALTLRVTAFIVFGPYAGTLADRLDRRKIMYITHFFRMGILALWLVAGFSQTLAEMPSQILIAEYIDKQEHGKVYGAHFAWSHLWWAIAYPIAGYTGTHFQNREFLIGAAISMVSFILVTTFILSEGKATSSQSVSLKKIHYHINYLLITVNSAMP